MPFLWQAQSSRKPVLLRLRSSFATGSGGRTRSSRRESWRQANTNGSGSALLPSPLPSPLFFFDRGDCAGRGTDHYAASSVPVARDASRARTPSAGGSLSRAETAVRKLTQDWALACNTKQLDDLVELYGPDAIVLRPNVPPMRGTASIREFFFTQLDAGMGEVEMESLRTEVFGDIAYEAGRCQMLVPVAMGQRREERGKYLITLARQAGDWKILADCWSSDLSLGVSVEPGPAKSTAPAPGPPILRPPRKSA